MNSFTNSEVNLEVLKKRAYNMRWAEVDSADSSRSGLSGSQGDCGFIDRIYKRRVFFLYSQKRVP